MRFRFGAPPAANERLRCSRVTLKDLGERRRAHRPPGVRHDEAPRRRLERRVECERPRGALERAREPRRKARVAARFRARRLRPRHRRARRRTRTPRTARAPDRRRFAAPPARRTERSDTRARATRRATSPRARSPMSTTAASTRLGLERELESRRAMRVSSTRARRRGNAAFIKFARSLALRIHDDRRKRQSALRRVVRMHVHCPGSVSPVRAGSAVGHRLSLVPETLGRVAVRPLVTVEIRPAFDELAHDRIGRCS